MSMNLQQGANAVIPEPAVFVGIGWSADEAWEIDASAFLVGQNGKVRCDQDFIFYNQPEAPSGCISLDSEPGTGEDMRGFHVHFSQVPEDVSKIIFTMTLGSVNEPECSPVFRMLNRVYIRVIRQSGEGLTRYDLMDADQEVAMLLGELYRYKNAWKFRAIGQGYNGGLGVLAADLGVNINAAPEAAVDTADTADTTVTLKSNRKTQKQIWAEKAITLQQGLNRFIPQIQAAVEGQINESNTRMIIDKILMDVFGYQMEEIKAEQEVQGRRADYVLAIDNRDTIVAEVKKAGLPLRHRHVFQATSYGAYSGIRWALLTNLTTWQVYHISTQDKVEANLVFSVNLLPGVKLEDCERLLLISRYGISRKGALEKNWKEVSALTHESIIRAILTEDVISKIRVAIKRDTGCSFENNQIQPVLEEILIHG